MGRCRLDPIGAGPRVHKKSQSLLGGERRSCIDLQRTMPYGKGAMGAMSIDRLDHCYPAATDGYGQERIGPAQHRRTQPPWPGRDS